MESYIQFTPLNNYLSNQITHEVTYTQLTPK